MSEVLEARRLLASVVSSDLVLDVKQGQKQGFDVTFDTPVSSGGASAALVTLGATATPVSFGTPTGAGTATHGWRTTAANGRLPRGNFDLIVGGSALSGEHLDASHYFLNGDLDRDRALDNDDINIMAANHGRDDADVSWLDGDVNLDGMVGNADFSLMHGQFGNRVNPAPDAPTELVVDAVGPHGANVAWSTEGYSVPGAADVDGFVAYRSADGTTFSEVGSVAYDAAGARSYFADSGLTDGAKYWYRVRPYVMVDHDANPSTAPTRALGHTGPKAWAVTTLKQPTDVAAEKVNAWQARVTWAPGSASAASHRVYASRDGGATWVVVAEIAASEPNVYTYHSTEDATLRFSVQAVAPAISGVPVLTPASGVAVKALVGEQVAFDQAGSVAVPAGEVQLPQGMTSGPASQQVSTSTGVRMTTRRTDDQYVLENGSPSNDGWSGYSWFTVVYNTPQPHTEVRVSVTLGIVEGTQTALRSATDAHSMAPPAGAEPVPSAMYSGPGFLIVHEGESYWRGPRTESWTLNLKAHRGATTTVSIRVPRGRGPGAAHEAVYWGGVVNGTSLTTWTPSVAMTVPSVIREDGSDVLLPLGHAVVFTRSGDHRISDLVLDIGPKAYPTDVASVTWDNDDDHSNEPASDLPKLPDTVTLPADGSANDLEVLVVKSYRGAVLNSREDAEVEPTERFGVQLNLQGVPFTWQGPTEPPPMLPMGVAEGNVRDEDVYAVLVAGHTQSADPSPPGYTINDVMPVPQVGMFKLGTTLGGAVVPNRGSYWEANKFGRIRAWAEDPGNHAMIDPDNALAVCGSTKELIVHDIRDAATEFKGRGTDEPFPVQLVGYSHGGGLIYKVSFDLANLQAAGDINLDVRYSAYVDAVDNPDFGPKQSVPALTTRLTVFYQNEGPGIEPRGGRITAAGNPHNIPVEMFVMDYALKQNVAPLYPDINGEPNRYPEASQVDANQADLQERVEHGVIDGNPFVQKLLEKQMKLLRRQ